MTDIPPSADNPSSTTTPIEQPKETPKIDYNSEYTVRFAKAKAEAEAGGFKYEHPNRAAIGWKVHLAVPDDPQDQLTSRIAEFVDRRRLSFKVGKGGSTEDGKGMTIYIGDRDAMEDFASELNGMFGEEIPEQRGDALDSDMPIVGNVWARFENTKDYKRNVIEKEDIVFKTVKEAKYLQYGPHGVPALRADAMDQLRGTDEGKPTGKQMRERAVTALTEDYGAFFTGTRNHPV